MPSILAVIVLYGMRFEDSPTWQSLRRAIQTNPALEAGIELVVADNSPQPQQPPAAFAGRYLHDGTNPGLARRYNQALALAASTGASWLLTLDQDTTLTAAYLEELLLLSTEYAESVSVVAFVPRLISHHRIYSPHKPRFQLFSQGEGVDTIGVSQRQLQAFNSAALLRVSSLNAIGGYPEEYWLDFLDHVVFRKLQRAGGRLYVMQSSLEHELSGASPETVSAARAKNIFLAEQRFYAEYGTSMEKLQNRIDLLRQVIGHGRRGRFKEANHRLQRLLRTR